MRDQRISPVEFTVEELDRELVARGAQIPGEKLFKFHDKEGTPERKAIMEDVKELYDAADSLSPNEALRDVSTWDLVRMLMLKTREIGGTRGIWNVDDRLDFYEIADERIKKNAHCTAAICLQEDLIDRENGFAALKLKNFGETFNLCDREPFQQQPTAAGPLCTGFLVKEDVIVTVAHFANERNVKKLRIVFGYKMSDSSTPITQVPDENIYKGVEIVRRVYNRMDRIGEGVDWALVKLDRKVEGQTIARLSEKVIYCDQPVYVLGYPCGLPLKYAPGAFVSDVYKTCFVADLDVYSGNSGSPVFDSGTHEVIGMVARGDNRDFRWAGSGWISVIYPNLDICSKGAQCNNVSEFIEYCR